MPPATAGGSHTAACANPAVAKAIMTGDGEQTSVVTFSAAKLSPVSWSLDSSPLPLAHIASNPHWPMHDVIDYCC